jgi:hypothetical protein
MLDKLGKLNGDNNDPQTKPSGSAIDVGSMLVTVR